MWRLASSSAFFLITDASCSTNASWACAAFALARALAAAVDVDSPDRLDI